LPTQAILRAAREWVRGKGEARLAPFGCLTYGVPTVNIIREVIMGVSNIIKNDVVKRGRG
jgi:hypothetical protein